MGFQLFVFQKIYRKSKSVSMVQEFENKPLISQECPIIHCSVLGQEDVSLEQSKTQIKIFTIYCKSYYSFLNVMAIKMPSFIYLPTIIYWLRKETSF